MKPSSLSTPKTANSRQTQGSWFALLSVAIGAFSLVTSEFLPVGVLNDVAKDLHISTGTAGLMISLPGITAALAAPLIPIFVKTLDRRYLLLILTMVMIISNTMSAFSSSFEQLLLSRLFLGAAIGAFWATAIALSGRIAPAHLSIANATACVVAGVTFASVFGVPIGTWLSQYYGWRSAFSILAVVGGLVFMLQLWFLPALKPMSALQWRQLASLFVHPVARKGLIIVLLIGFAHFSAFSYLAPFLKYQAHFDANIISTLLLVFGISGIFGNAFAGYFSNFNVRYCMALVAMIFALTFIGFPLLATDFIYAILLTLFWGFAFGAFPTTANIWMFLHAPQAVEKGMPLFVSFFQIVIATSALVGGGLFDQLGINSVLYSSLLFSSLAVLCLFTLTRGLNNPAKTIS